jgi:protein gp37
MAETSKIEWCDSTFNPWIGCTKIAPACDHCYAADMSKRYGWAEWGNHPRKRTSAGLWDGVRKWQRLAPAFLAEHGRRRRVFCASLADVFDNQVPAEWRADLFDLIARTPNLTWLLLTKRPENIAAMLPAALNWSNVWLGTSVEDQKAADHRVPILREQRPRVAGLFLSCEPLLGPIDFERGGFALHRPLTSPQGRKYPGIDWIIVGGETGKGARPMDPEWVRKIRDDCRAAGVPFFMKQWGDWHPDALRFTDTQGRCPPPGMRVGKAKAGRLLDGVLHDALPTMMG